MTVNYDIDHNLFLAMNFDGGAFWDNLFWFASGRAEWIPLYLLMLWLVYRRAGWRGMLLCLAVALLVVAGADHSANFFKNNISRLRPTHTPGIAEHIAMVKGYTGGLYGTVSAHAATTFGIALLTISVICSHWYTILALVWVALVSYSRIYLGVHFPLDVLFGLIDGAVMGMLGIWIYRSIYNRIKK